MNKPRVANAETEACDGGHRSTKSVKKEKDLFQHLPRGMQGHRSCVLKEEGVSAARREGNRNGRERPPGNGNTCARQTCRPS